jgi:hypothetical protein
LDFPQGVEFGELHVVHIAACIGASSGNEAIAGRSERVECVGSTSIHALSALQRSVQMDTQDDPIAAVGSGAHGIAHHYDTIRTRSDAVAIQSLFHEIGVFERPVVIACW